MTDDMKYNRINWIRIGIFFLIATLLSNIFRFDIFELNLIFGKLPTWFFIVIALLLEGSGVIIGALISISFVKKQKNIEMSLFGTSKSKSLIMVTIPIILLTFIGINNDFGINIYIYGLISGITTLLYCVMEEFGWRGYLHEELKILNPNLKYLIIGVIWYLWHLTFLTKASIGDNFFFLGMMIIGSWGIGQVADSTKSIMASACFHMIIQIMLLNDFIKNGINGTEKIIVLGVSVVIWYVIIKKWEKQSSVS